MRGRETKREGIAKSIPLVNLRLKIIYTMNKKGESPNGTGGGGG